MEEVKNDDKKYCVYMHVNKINNKVYVGQTCLDPERRWRKDGSGYKECTHFWRAIQKYGWDNFEHIIFAENLTREEANQMEISLIALYDTTNILYGYNLTNGGNATVYTKEVRKKISDNHADVSGENNPFYGKHHTEETKEKIRKKNKINFAGANNPMYGVRRYGEDGPMYGKKHTEDAKKKMSQNRKKKAVVQLDLNGNFISEYPSLCEAGRQHGSEGNIWQCCNNNAKTYKGFKWMYKEKWEEIQNAVLSLQE